VHGLRAVEVAAGLKDRAQVAVMGGDARPVVALLVDGQRLTVHGFSAVQVTPEVKDVSQVRTVAGD
jgi:hypothetical protein